MAELEIRQPKALRDDYICMLRDAETAATGTVDPSEPAPVLAARAETGWRLTRERNLPTVPATGDEVLATNPFLRADQPALQATMDGSGDAVATLAEIRRRKDVF